MRDRIEKIGHSTIHHGKASNRIYLLKLDPADLPGIIPLLDRLAEHEGYTKIFAKIEASLYPTFCHHGYSMEAFIPKFYRGCGDCIMASKFLTPERAIAPATLLEDFRQLLTNGRTNQKELPHLPYTLRPLKEDDAKRAAALFKEVFATYPFPVHDPGYLIQTMQNNSALYFGMWDDKRLIGISTAEIDRKNLNAEMTDFAVLPAYRGKKLALHLLKAMEENMQRSGIRTLYTIARLAEPGMNKTFVNMGYRYSGTLMNNTGIAGSIESMNIFYKNLSYAVRKTL